GRRGEAGYAVRDEAAHGPPALAAARAMRPDVVLLDVLLPDTPGFAVADALASEPVPPIVVLTSSRPEADFGGAVTQSRARGFIAKRDLTAAALTPVVLRPVS